MDTYVISCDILTLISLGTYHRPSAWYKVVGNLISPLDILLSREGEEKIISLKMEIANSYDKQMMRVCEDGRPFKGTHTDRRQKVMTSFEINYLKKIKLKVRNKN